MRKAHRETESPPRHSQVALTPTPEWCALVDGLPLECDGLSRVISTLLQRDKIPHRVLAGSLTIEGEGSIPYHWWIVFPDGSLCDYRARMWLGDATTIPHGVFVPRPAHQYVAHNEIDQASTLLSPSLFLMLTNISISTIPKFSEFGTLVRSEAPRAAVQYTLKNIEP